MIICLPGNLKHEWQSNFMSDFVMPLREMYDSALAEHKYSSLTSFCSQGDWISLLTEVIVTITHYTTQYLCTTCNIVYRELALLAE